MAVLVIAGSGRGAGKTSVGAGLVAALPGFRWMAMKISPHRHDEAGQEAGGDGAGTDSEMPAEFESDREKDTTRYLRAGADRAFLIQAVQHASLVRWIAEEREREREDDGLVIESNALTAKELTRAGEGEATLAIVAGPEADWKPSLRKRIGMADALVLAPGVGPDDLPPDLQGKPLFALKAGVWVTPELTAFVLGRLQG